MEPVSAFVSAVASDASARARSVPEPDSALRACRGASLRRSSLGSAIKKMEGELLPGSWEKFSADVKWTGEGEKNQNPKLVCL